MTAPRKVNVARMRKRVQPSTPTAADVEPDGVEPIVIRDLNGDVIRVIYPNREA